jgi:protein-L-isoaspartate(D-aspartate) O-methyltransferase
MAHMVGPTGRVVGIDHIPELVQRSEANIRADGGAELLESGRLSMVVGDGREGCQDKGPYHAIHVGAAAAELPQALVDQVVRHKYDLLN